MARRCIFGCRTHGTLFPFPKIPSLRSRWLDFLHFEEGGITEWSRMCSKHFTRECFINWTEYEMGFVRYLSLTDNAVPSVYTVGTSQIMANKNSFIITISVTIGTHRDARECELAPEPPRPGDRLNSPHITAQTCKV
uniref:THAP domain-containing protein 1 n=1 Tax=Cyprinus carpio carpio TaxID=630221 RepID=A0A8C1C5I9_CYPCA